VDSVGVLARAVGRPFDHLARRAHLRPRRVRELRARLAVRHRPDIREREIVARERDCGGLGHLAGESSSAWSLDSPTVKVAMLTREYPPEVYGGAGVHVEYLTRELGRLVDVDVLCFGRDRDGARAFRPCESATPGGPAL